MPNEYPLMCSVCGLPGGVVNLARITWVDNPGGYYRHGVDPMRAIVAKKPSDNDVLLCTDCIRDIKRIPFSDFAEVDIPF